MLFNHVSEVFKSSDNENQNFREIFKMGLEIF